VRGEGGGKGVAGIGTMPVREDRLLATFLVAPGGALLVVSGYPPGQQGQTPS
jgi:hypothetical protein